MDSVIKKLREDLQLAASEQCRISTQRFFKEPIKNYGVKSADLNRIIHTHVRRVKSLTKDEAFVLCETLWKSGYQEECMVACRFSNYFSHDYQPQDFSLFEKWISDYVTNWATCDTFCNHTVGDFIVQFPEFISELKKWARSQNRWLRRAAAVSLILPAKRGKFLTEVFNIADILLLDDDDMVQKGYGWMLKAASEEHTPEVFDYVMSNRQRMPRVSLRYAIEKMPKDLKIKAMKK